MRRQAIDEQRASGIRSVPLFADTDLTESLSILQKSELRLREKNRLKRKVDALKVGHLPDDAVTQDLVEAAAEQAERERKCQMDGRAVKRRALKGVIKSIPDFDGKLVCTGRRPATHVESCNEPPVQG